MKKILPLTAALLLALLCICSSCGGETLSPSERADKMVIGWDKAALNLYRYSGRSVDYDGHEGYMVVMNPDPAAFSDMESLEEYQSGDNLDQCAAQVYEQLRACFEDCGEIYIIVAICGAGERVIATYLNGERLS